MSSYHFYDLDYERDKFINDLNTRLRGTTMTRKPITIIVECNDILESAGDVLILKYAQQSYGVDREVAMRLKSTGALDPDELPEHGEYHFLNSNGAVDANAVLFVGTVPLGDFGYQDVREFARLSLANLSIAAPQTESVLVTLHGVNYFLDEIESFESEIAGFVDAINTDEFPEALLSIKVVDKDPGRVDRLKVALDKLLPDGVIPLSPTDPSTYINATSAGTLRSVGYNSASKPFVFVAMPFAEKMDDIFYYGIQQPIKNAGFLCERADKLSFIGDIMERVKDRIKRASFIVADLTGSNPNVYLEVGYAWGLGRPTILLSSEKIEFDVRGQRCLFYKSIKDLEQKLYNELLTLSNSEMIDKNDL